MTKGSIAGVALLGSIAFAQGKAPEPAAKAKPAPAAADKTADKTAPKAEMPKPPAELEVEKWFDGKWKCEGTQHAGPMGPEGKYTNALTTKMDMQGWWLSFHVDREKGPMPGAQLSGFSTWDPVTKKHVRTDFSVGGMWSSLTTPGWEGDKLAFGGDMMMMGKKVPIRQTFTKKGDAEFSSVFEVTGPDGKLMPMVEETCKKSGAKK